MLLELYKRDYYSGNSTAVLYKTQMKIGYSVPGHVRRNECAGMRHLKEAANTCRPHREKRNTRLYCTAGKTNGKGWGKLLRAYSLVSFIPGWKEIFCWMLENGANIEA